MSSRVKVVYLCHGREEYLMQARYSLLSLLHYVRPMPEAERPFIQIYTDRPEFFPVEGVEIHFRLLTEEDKRLWKGRYGYIHRIKAEVIKEAAEGWNGPLLFLDSDTKWDAPPDEIFRRLDKGDVFFNWCEGPISQPLFQHYHRLLSEKTILVKGERVSAEISMWNSGVLGLPAQYLHVPAEALHLLDYFYQQPLSERGVVEQFMFSILLPRLGPVHESREWLIHYYAISKYSYPVLQRFFAANAHLKGADMERAAANFKIRKEINALPHRTPPVQALKTHWRSWKRKRAEDAAIARDISEDRLAPPLD